MDLRYRIKNTKLKKKKKFVHILSVGRIYVQVSSYHQDELVYRLDLDSETEVYRKIGMTKDIDRKEKKYANFESNMTPYKNHITGSWVWFNFLEVEEMDEIHRKHLEYDSKSFLAHSPKELLKHLEHDAKASNLNMANYDKELTAEFIVDNIENDWCKNYVNNAILEDLNIRRVTMSQNLLFPPSIYRKCRVQLIDYDDRHEEIYFTTKQLENSEIAIEKNSLYTKVVDVKTGLTIAKFNTKAKKEVYDVTA